MVNYACIGRSLGKFLWRPVAILTCKSFVTPGYRGDRLTEPSSSWPAMEYEHRVYVKNIRWGAEKPALRRMLGTLELDRGLAGFCSYLYVFKLLWN